MCFECDFCFSSGLRGATADVVVLEEAAHMDEDIFFKVVLPLLGVDNTCIIGISSPEDELNYFSELVQSKDDNGQTIFKVIRIGMTCDACMAAQKENCKHRLRILPPWKSAARHTKVKAIYGLKNKKLMERETEGAIVSNRQYCFSPEWIQRLNQPDRIHTFKRNVDVVHMAIDPSGAGDASSYAVVSMATEDSKRVVI